jgi:zona occludens toxin
MIYLTTGANGAGKTLNTLKLVREKQIAEGRSVYFNGFAMKPEKAAEFGWKEFDPKEWQKLPDGAILICDECQNEFPVRPSTGAVPEYVRALSEHRRRGFDFFMITQHPQNIDNFVRRLIGSPGYHRHLKRAFGAQMVSVLEWSAVNSQCEKDGAGKSARVSMAPYPSEVFGWYDSASLHTAKKSIPRQFYVLALASLLVPAMLYFAYTKMTGPKSAPVPVAAAAGPTSPGALPPGVSSETLSPTQFLASYVPRLEGMPQTAPRYDDVTKATIAPYPAACVSMGDRCDCFTQQGTKLQTPKVTCESIVASGFFVDWAAGGTGGDRKENEAAQRPADRAGAPAAVPDNPGARPLIAPVAANMFDAPPVQRVASAGDLDALASMRQSKRSSF